jgi:hypothetical protein
MEAELQDAKLKTHHGDDADTLEEMKTQKSLYPKFNLWWVRHCKSRLRQMFRHEETKCRRENRNMENFYHECI